LAWGSYAPFLKITTVSVSGTKTVAPSALQELVQQDISGSYLYLFAKDDILLYPRTQVAADLLAQYPQLKSVDVHAADFHTVAVNVIERQPVALWCSSLNSEALGTSTESLASSTADELSEPVALPAHGACYFMDQDGVVYQSAPPADASYVIYQSAATSTVLPMQFLTPDQFHALSALATALSQKFGTTTVSDVSVDSSGDVQAQFSDGFILEFLLTDAGGDVFDNFTLALQSDVFKQHSLDDFQYLDLRFGQKLYYKLK
jgi:hypothetical protein